MVSAHSYLLLTTYESQDMESMYVFNGQRKCGTYAKWNILQRCKGVNLVTCDKMDKLQEYYISSSKSSAETYKYVLHDLIHMESLTNIISKWNGSYVGWTVGMKKQDLGDNVKDIILQWESMCSKNCTKW